MGVVHLARQPALSRRVALKSLLPELRGDQAMASNLVREAQITGALEHPNIVPVYDIRYTSAGEPQIVLRRIEGAAWSELMHDAAELARRFDVRDPLEWNLRVLMQVCNAVAYAHSRGVIHRDLKPENVMIGEFGEVYVLDWGIAAGLEGSEGETLCGAAAASMVVGTPDYMAPEMLLGDPEQLSPRIDVYLLGAILHELLTGRPPRSGNELERALRSALHEPIERPSDAPRPLARLCERALSRHPDARPANVTAFRDELRRFLRTRHSELLLTQASARLVELERAVAAVDPHDRAREHAIYNLFGQSRFGLQQVLFESPEHSRAQAELRRAIELIARYELARGNAEAAATFAAEIKISSELRGQIDAALVTAKRELSSLRSLARDNNPYTGARARRVLAWSLATLWIVPPLLLTLTSSPPRESHLGMVALSGGLLGVISVSLWAARAAIQRTSINRRAADSFLYLGFALVVLAVAMALTGASPSATVINSLLVCFSAATMLTVAVDQRLLPTALACALAYLGASAMPELRYAMISSIGLVFLVNAELIWRTPEAAPATPR